MGATYTRQSSYADGDIISAADTNDEFNQLLAAFASSTGHTHDGTDAEGGPITKLLGNTLTFGAATSGTDITITFDGETNDGVLKWMEDEDYFEFSDDILVASTEKLQFRDTAIYINSSTDGQLDLVADSEIQIAATTIDINGNVDISGTLTIGGADISETELEILDGATVTTTEINILDGDTSATSTTVVDADRVVFNDAGTMKQVAVTDLAAYFDDEITAMPNLVTTAATTVGALNSGSITSGFGTIDTGSSTITTTGLITGGSLDIDDVLINGTTIGHTDDTDLITLANGVVTIAGEISVTTLDIGGTNITSTPAELNILDGDTTASSTTVADADRVVFNDAGTMKQVAVTDLAAYFDDEITAMPNLTSVGTLTTLTVDNVIINGSTIGHTGDTDLMTVASGVLTVAGEVDAASLDISGDADIDGTLEADAITVNGTALNTVIAGVTVTDATNSAHVLVTDNESTNEENLITFVENATTSTGNVGLEMDGNLAYNPSTGTVTATIFKGNIDAVDGDFDGTLEADAITLDGSAITTVATLSTGISNGNLPVFTSGAADNDFLRIDGTSIEGRSASEVLSDIAAAPAAGSSNIVTTGAINSGSITSGFGAINNGSSAITTTGTMTFGSLSDGSITVTAFVDEDDMSSDSATLIPTQQSVKAFVENNAGAPAAGSSNIVTTGALNSGSITSGFGSIDTGSSNITTTGTGSFGVINATDGCTITTADNTAQLKLESTDADANVGPILEMTRNSSSPADNDILARIDFKGDNDAAEETFFGSINAVATDVSNGAEDGQIKHRVMVNGTVTSVLDLDANGASVTGGITATAASTITTSDNSNNLTLTSTDADANTGPNLVMHRDSGSPADNDAVGEITFNFDNDAGEHTVGNRWRNFIIDATDSTEDAAFDIFSMKDGSLTSIINYDGSELIFNDGSADIDFRVESDNESVAFVVEGSTGNIGIGTGSPTLDASLAGVSTPSGTTVLHMNDTDGAYLKITDPASGNNRGAQVALFGTAMIVNNCESDKIIFGTGNSQKMQLTSSGNLRLGQSGTDHPGSGNSTTGISLRSTGDAFFSDTDSAAIYGNCNSDGTVVSIAKGGTAKGGISVSDSGVTFNTTSDRRLKENIEPLEATDKLMDMNPVLFNWKDNPDGPKNMGFIAQDMQNIMPEAVSFDDTEEKMLRMDYGRITPILVSALQNAHKKIEELESRIVAMESK